MTHRKNAGNLASRRVSRSCVWLLFGVSWCSAGCNSNASLKVGGDTPYVRCLAAAAPASLHRQLGGLKLTLTDRRLDVVGRGSDLRLAAFSGPGFGDPPTAGDILALRAAHPDVLVLLGDLGDSAATAKATASRLAGVGCPVLVLAGGRDTRDRINDATGLLPSSAPPMIDVTALRVLSIANETFLPVAGALDGRDGLEAASCGYAEEDLREIAKQARSIKGRKWLLAWQAPAQRDGSLGVASAAPGIDLGSMPLGRLAASIGVAGGLFAWPHVQAARAFAEGRGLVPIPAGGMPLSRWVVPRLVGPALERADGSRLPPGFSLLQVGPNGLRILETRSTLTKIAK